MKINLNRSDKQYTDVENFKKYELTNCVVYEMAIRNKRVNELIKSYISELKKYFIDLQSLYSEYHLKRQNNYNELRKYFINPLSLYLKYHFFTEEEQKKETFIKDIYPYEKEEFKFKGNKEEEQKIVTVFTKKTKEYEVRSSKSIKIIHDGSITSYNTWLRPIYSRPQIFSAEQEKTAQIELNLAIPKNELIDFIEKMKDSYDKNNQSILSISELLEEEEVQPFKDMIFKKENEHIKDRKTKKAIRATSYTSNAFKMADILFIYDCLVLGYSYQKIIYLLVDYYDTCNKKDTIDPERYRRYVAIGKDFIDNMRYKELFLGSSI